jgi:hypothetical protein
MDMMRLARAIASEADELKEAVFMITELDEDPTGIRLERQAEFVGDALLAMGKLLESAGLLMIELTGE